MGGETDWVLRRENVPKTRMPRGDREMRREKERGRRKSRRAGGLE